MVKNPEAAITDLNKAIEKSEKFALAYFARAYARYVQHTMQGLSSTSADIPTKAGDAQNMAMLASRKDAMALGDIIADFDLVLKYSPKNVYAMYDKGFVYMQMQDNTAAVSAFTEAIEAKPDFGEAYYNRGLVYLRLGNKEKGLADLSKAGELGILPSYNVLKRMQR